MTPKEKAKDLVFSFENQNMMFEADILEDAKQSALITVNEILEVLSQIFESYDKREYWDKVIEEIAKL